MDRDGIPGSGTFCYKEHCSVLLPAGRFKHRMSGTVNLSESPRESPPRTPCIACRNARLRAIGAEERRSLPLSRRRPRREARRARTAGRHAFALYVARADGIEAARRGLREEVWREGGL